MPSKELTRVTTVIDANRTIENTRTYERVSLLEKYFTENLLKSFAAVLTGLGLIGVYAYHFSVEYYPVFDIQSAASLIFAVAYTGLILLGTMSLFLLFPAFLVSACVIDRSRLGTSDYLPKLVLLCFAVFFFAFLAACLALVILKPGNWSAYLVFPGMIVLGVLIWYVLKRKGLSPTPEQGYFATTACLLQFLPIFMFLLIMQQPDQNGLAPAFDEKEFMLNALIIDIYIQFVGGYFVIAWNSPTLKAFHKILSLLAPCLAVFVILAIVNRPAFIGYRIANIAKFGNFYATELSLSKEGCKAVNSYASKTCLGNEEIGYKLCGAFIVSRIGSESFIRLYEEGAKVGKESATEAKQNPFTKSVFMSSKEILAMTVHDVKGMAAARDTMLLAGIATCRAANAQTFTTAIPVRGEEYFEFDKAELGASGKTMLAQIADRLASLSGDTWQVTIVGHSDQIGDARHNQKLSEDRAAAVATFLRLHLPESAAKRIAVQGAGNGQLKKTEAQCPPTMEREKRIECLADNRRTDIVLEIAPSAKPGAAPGGK